MSQMTRSEGSETKRSTRWDREGRQKNKQSKTKDLQIAAIPCATDSCVSYSTIYQISRVHQ